MNVLLLGSGGREHALATKIHQSEKLSKLWAYPGNPGILSLAERASVSSDSATDIIPFCKQNSIDLVVVGPEQPLASGLADRLAEEGIPCFGPTKLAAELESSKIFAKDFMISNSIPTAEYRTFSLEQADECYKYLADSSIPVVIKADGLAAGKGVIIAQSHEEAISAARSMFGGLFKEAGSSIVIEEFMKGEEASIFAISDGNDFVLLAPAQDHKRIGDGDTGKNTGGMGAYAPAPIANNDILHQVSEKIIRPTLDGMRNIGRPFVGCLYAGLMINKGIAKVVEFNCRFGDPETQAVLLAMDGDLLQLLHSAAVGSLDKTALKNPASNHVACVVLASGGYPDEFTKGYTITGIDAAQSGGATVFHAGTAESNGAIVSAGGRVLNVCASGPTLQSALDSAYGAIKKINFNNMYFRSDIGAKAGKH